MEFNTIKINLNKSEQFLIDYFLENCFTDKSKLRKIKKSPSTKFLAMLCVSVSLLLSSCNSSIKSESNQSNNNQKQNELEFIPASKEEMNLYRQIGVSYFCLARQAKVEFQQSISIASNNFALIISKKHGGLIDELGSAKLTNDQIYQGSYLQLIEGAIQLCPDQVPEENKKNFLKALEQLNQKN